MRTTFMRRAFIPLIIGGTILSGYAFAEMTRAKETDILYFDQYGNQVGEIFYPCVGRVIRWGVTTENSQTFEIDCKPPTPPTPPGPGAPQCPPSCP